jgi:hypothetical protein
MSRDKLDTFDDEFNPFQAPEATAKGPVLIDGPADLREAELIRRKYLNHEASVKAIGWLNILGSFIFIPAGVFVTLLGFGAVTLPDQQLGEMQKLAMVGLGAFLFTLGVVWVFVGIGLRKLRSWARITEGVLSLLSALLNFIRLNPFALIPCYIAYLMLSEKGRMVCSPEYHRVIAATPHIKYRTHWLVKTLLIILMLVLLLGIAGFIFSSMSDN